MLSLRSGRPVARLSNKNIIGIVEDEKEMYDKFDGERDSTFKEYHVNNGSLTPLPDFKNRFISYTAGPSGSGKSTYIAGTIKEWHNINPKKSVYFFGRCDIHKDPAFKGMKYIIQIPIDDSLIEEPIDITEEIAEEGCLMIFDDCLSITDDKLRKEVEKLIIEGMEIGRKLNCNMIITSHLINPNDKKLGRSIMNEITSLTVFPKSGSTYQINFALKNYWGMNNKQIQKILELPSRWVTISKSYPIFIMYEKGIYILN